jgi:protein-disulfide isomerase/uncharacterized membrane protein
MTATLTSRRWYFLQLIFAALGVGTSLYLLVQHTRLKTGIQGGSALCSFGQYADCNVVNASQYAELGGVPLAALGILYFACLFMLGLSQPPATRGHSRAQVWMARLALAALAVDVWLIGVQAFAIHSFCLFCLFTYLCTAGHLATNWLQQPRGVRNRRHWLVGERKAHLAPFALAANLVVLIAVGTGLFQYVFSSENAAQVASMEQSKKVFLETWSTRPAKSIPIGENDPSWGNSQAKVRVVVFSDFECPHCQRAAFALHTALASSESQVQLVFKNFPLDMACNPLLQRPVHPNSCALAKLGYCANAKKKFWEYHDRVFFKLSAREISSAQDAIHDGVKNIFTRKEFDDCMANQEALAHTQRDIDLGKNLEIDSTPAIFINGKRVSFTPTVDLIRDLVQRELAGK